MSHNSVFNLILLIGVTFFSIFEIKSAIYLKNASDLSQTLQSHLSQFNFLSELEKTEKVDKVRLDRGNLSTPLLSHNNVFELGRIEMIAGLESSNTDEKIKRLCSARNYFIHASHLMPRNSEYHLAVADIESISPSLQATCDNLLPQNQNSISLQERLDFIKELAPFDPPTLYKSALILKAKGNRLQAMKSFRLFEETSLESKFIYRKYLMSQALNEDELKELLPRKLPILLTWLNEYSKTPNPNIDFLPVFESVFTETLNLLAGENFKPQVNQNSTETLINLYHAKEIQTSEKIKLELAKLIYKNLSSDSEDLTAREVFKIISNSKRVQSLISTDLSSISKKTSQIYNWQKFNSSNSINIDIRSKGIGVYFPVGASSDYVFIQGSKTAKLPKDLKIELWTSTNNVEYAQTGEAKPEIKGEINQSPILVYKLPNLNSKYSKFYFSFNQENSANLTAPISTAIQFYKAR